MSAATPPAATGRWYLVSDLLATAVPSTAEQRGAAIADVLLERHGIVTRAAVAAEGVPGGFSGCYPVLSAMEDAGRVRRGYFVEGAGGAQFGLPGAIDRLRATTEPTIRTLAATDPAQAYGAVVAWPDHDAAQPARRAGARCVLYGGDLVVYIERAARRLLTFGDDDGLKVTAIAESVPRGATVEAIDGQSALGHPLRGDLELAGFTVGYKGLTRRAPRERSHARG